MNSPIPVPCIQVVTSLTSQNILISLFKLSLYIISYFADFSKKLDPVQDNIAANSLKQNCNYVPYT